METRTQPAQAPPPQPRAQPHAAWTIDRMVPGGDGFARLDDGRVGFATGALPGDIIRPLELRERRSFLRAVTWQLVEPSPDRVASPCPAAERCGGCGWMPLARTAQLRAKAGLLREALVRTGGFRELPERLAVSSTEQQLRYRNRLRLQIDESGRVGLFSRASHCLVEIPDCLVGPPDTAAVLRLLREYGQRHPGALGAFRQAQLRVAPGGPPVALHMTPRSLDRPLTNAAGSLLDALAGKLALSVAGIAGFAHGDQRWPLPGEVELLAPPQAFTQVNWAVNSALIRTVIEGVRQRNLQSFCDLYCGAGNFALPLLAAGLRGIGIDRCRASVEAARRAAKNKGLPDNGFSVSSVGRKLRGLRRQHARFDLLLLDPPRGGAREVLAQVCKLRPRHLAICACDPVTLARDLRTLAQRGYLLEAVAGFDMFPHTHHLEALAWMRRSRRITGA